RSSGCLRFTVTLPSTCPSDDARREEWETRVPTLLDSRTTAPDQRLCIRGPASCAMKSRPAQQIALVCFKFGGV
ncbi:hypothetical protein EV363DRAFT_1171369, partial [Boletus edulis]